MKTLASLPTAWEIAFAVPGEPIAQPRHRMGKQRGGKKAGQPILYLDKDDPVHAYKEAVLIAARQAMAAIKGAEFPLKVPLEMVAIFYLSKADLKALRSWFKAKPDCDNLMKSTKDALTGFVYTDDALVVAESCAKVQRSKNETARALVIIRPAADVGPTLKRLAGRDV